MHHKKGQHFFVLAFLMMRLSVFLHPFGHFDAEEVHAGGDDAAYVAGDEEA